MAKLTHVSVVLVGVVAGTAALAAVMSSGCSSSTSSESPDSGADGTTTQFDASQTQVDGSSTQVDAPPGADVVTPPADGGTADGATGDAATGDAADAAADASDAADAEDAGDAPTACTTIIGLTGPVAETDAGPATDAGDAAAEASATDATAGDAAATDATAGDAAATDATAGDAAATDATTGDASAVDATADAVVDAGPLVPTLLFGFDGVSGAPAGWSLYIQDPMDAGMFVPVLGSTITDGATCLGALTVNAAFTAFDGQLVQAQYNYPTPMDWTGRKTLHFAVKVVATAAGFETLSGVQGFVGSGPSYANYRASFMNAATFSDGAFHQIAVDLSLDDAGVPDAATNAYDPNEVDNFGVQILSTSAAPDGGPATPGSAELIVDDVWIE
jgi:hypothetical protein